jgi:hypothetical protein
MKNSVIVPKWSQPTSLNQTNARQKEKVEEEVLKDAAPVCNLSTIQVEMPNADRQMPNGEQLPRFSVGIWRLTPVQMPLQ